MIVNKIIRIDFLEDTEKEYYAALSWLNDLGVKIDASRLMQTYKRVIKSKKEQLSPDEVWSSLELHEAHELYKTFSELPELHENIRVNLKKIIKGQLFLKDEVISGTANNGRNYMFELSMVEYFIKREIHIRFDSKADFNIATPYGNVFFECKRPALESTLLTNTLEAFKQINNRGTPSDSGVVCISLSRIIWEKMKSGILNSKLDDITSYVLNLANEELEIIKRCWDFNKHKKTILIITDIKVPFVNPETNDLLFFQHKNFNFRYWEMHLAPPWNYEVITKGIISKAIINQFENENMANPIMAK